MAKAADDAGQAPNDDEELPEAGLLGPVAAAYADLRLSKSVLVVTVFWSVEIVTMPNWPAAEAAGK
jgi:hypothetical protein